MDKPTRLDQSSLGELYSSLIEINQKSFASGEYDVAYHALSGALHCAASLKDIKCLHQVKQLAGQQLAWN